MQVLEVGQVWKYKGESHDKYGEEYTVVQLLPAIKIPNWGWHRGVRYVPNRPVENAPNDYVRLDNDFLSRFQFVR